MINCREENGRFIVDVSRGRFIHTPHHKQEIFDEKEQFFSFLKSNIRKRRRHGYNIADMSLDFPLFKILYEMT